MLIQFLTLCLICKPILPSFKVFNSHNSLLILKRTVISQSSPNYSMDQIFCQKLTVSQICSRTSHGLLINLKFFLFLKMLQTLFMLKAFLLMLLKEKFLIFLDPFLVIRLSVWFLGKRNLVIRLSCVLQILSQLCKLPLSSTLFRAIASIRMIF